MYGWLNHAWVSYNPYLEPFKYKTVVFKHKQRTKLKLDTNIKDPTYTITINLSEISYKKNFSFKFKLDDTYFPHIKGKKIDGTKTLIKILKN